MTFTQFWNGPLQEPSNWAFLLFVLFLVAVGILAWQMRVLACLILASPIRAKLRRKALLTDNEAEFFSRLKRALPDFEVLAQVSMGALMEPVVSSDDPNFWAIRKRFHAKICDYVVTRKGAPKNSAVVAVIELDDRTHDAQKDAARDALLASVGIRTVRYESKAKPSEREIRSQILALA